MTGPTDKQLHILRLIAKSITERGMPPTIRELLTALKLRSTNSMSDHLNALQRKGLLERGEFQARALRLTTKGKQLLGLPTWKTRVARAGAAAEAVRQTVLDEIERRMKATSILLPNADSYRAALADLAGWLEGADVAELLGEKEAA